RPAAGAVDPVDERALVVGLQRPNFCPQLLGGFRQPPVDLREGGRPVDVGLPLPQQVEVGPVQHQHPYGLGVYSARCSLRTSVIHWLGTSSVTNAWPMRSSSTKRRRPSRTFLSRCMTANSSPSSNGGGAVGKPARRKRRTRRSTSSPASRPSRCDNSAALTMPMATASPCRYWR